MEEELGSGEKLAGSVRGLCPPRAGWYLHGPITQHTLLEHSCVPGTVLGSGLGVYKTARNSQPRELRVAQNDHNSYCAACIYCDSDPVPMPCVLIYLILKGALKAGRS